MWHLSCGGICLLTNFWLFPHPGGDGSGEGVAPRALCVHWVWDRVGQSQFLWERWTAVLRVRLLHPLLPPLCTLQQAHTKCKRLKCSCVSCVLYNTELIFFTPTARLNIPSLLKPFDFLFLFSFRKWSLLWTRTGTQSVSAALSAAGRLERKVMGGTYPVWLPQHTTVYRQQETAAGSLTYSPHKHTT